MDTDYSGHETSPDKSEAPKEQITRRRLLTISAKSVAGLSMVPLADALAGRCDSCPEKVNIMMSDLFADGSPVGLNLDDSVSSAVSAICDLVGDLNCDGIVDEQDLREMGSNWLSISSATSAIANLDGSYTHVPGITSSMVSVDLHDFSIMAKNWKKTSATSAVGWVDIRNARRQRQFAGSVRQRFSRTILKQLELT